ncbi:DUF6328 family protein [Aeromicrobium sp. IC_218]|uniref:DUF6328 family protein n=1 Tax=Aeromicrobium sp. IC_218 TaxID=2545468 RepID=UPI00103E0729|nr:DUF6328 family protein [Aeromicrobium sp. IC_218]TCI97557.1 sodium:proton antiporter [Aeromicrobium sp. IC_218]
MGDDGGGSPHPSSSRRLDDNWEELLQELRVAQTGVQILTGFLLTLPFSDAFEDVPPHSRVVYGCVLGCAVVATLLLLTPVALHRALFRRGERPWLVETADAVARAGLVAMALANIGAVWLILDFVFAPAIAWGFSAFLVVGLLVGWVAVPMVRRRAAGDD